MTQEAVPPTLFEAIRLMVTEQTNVPVESIKPQTRLGSDLGITGDDAYELLDMFAERFHVKFDGFVFLDHFEWEGWDLTTPLFVGFMASVSPRFAQLWKEAKDREREITIQHLADCAVAGHWMPSNVRKPPSSSTYFAGLQFFFRTVFLLVGAGLLICAFAGIIFGFVMAIDSQSGKNAFLGLIALVGCVLFLLLMARMTRQYLHAKEVWRRLSPVAE